jgi:predicted TIM-barrel enzyme
VSSLTPASRNARVRAGVHLGAQTAGVAVGGVVGWRSGSIVACVVLAVAMTALVRAL